MNQPSEYDLFLEAIAKEPDDWFPRLVFADWLIEQGDPRGEMLHLLHDLLRFECEDRETKQTRYLDLYHRGHIIPSPSGPMDISCVLIPPGEVLRGNLESPHSQPEKITIQKHFWIGRLTVTRHQWNRVMGEDPPEVEEGHNYFPSMPVTNITYSEAKEFCKKYHDYIVGNYPTPYEGVFRLPTEEEWEYACRAGTRTPFSFGNDESILGEYAWHLPPPESPYAREEFAHPVGVLKPNPWGLFDLHGNVAEICRASLDPDMSSIIIIPRTSMSYHCRGGCWSDVPSDCQSNSYRVALPNDRGADVGLRLVFSPT